MDAASSNPTLATDTVHSPTQLWSYRVPSPPRLNVPPPAVNRRGVPEINLNQGGTLDFESNGFTNVEFLKAVTYDNLVTQNAMLEWKYEQRRQAQQILPFLWLGPVTAARDAVFLQKEGITMVLAVRNTLSAQARLLGSKAAEALGIESRAVDVTGNQELIAAFPRAIEIINRHLCEAYEADMNRPGSANESDHATTPGRVLIFCETGNERSATLVVAYIMAMYSTDCVKAIQLAQAQRFAVSIDDSLKYLLQSYESILKAKRDVIQAGSLGDSLTPVHYSEANSEPRRNSKRNLDEVYDDMEVDGPGEDIARSEERNALAPFQD